MKILITGAAGFIGYHLCRKLIKCDCEVIGLDNINSYYDVDLKYLRLENLGINQDEIFENKQCKSKFFSNFIFTKLDLCEKEKLTELLIKEKFDIVCNLAAQAGVRYSIENPDAYIDSNISGFMNILEGCRIAGIRNLLYASSSSVYGLNEKQPFVEVDKTEKPVSMYAATKKANELMAHVYSNMYGFNTIGLRFFTVYGPFGRPDMAYFSFAKKIFSEQSINVYNNGNMKRDFTYIDDIIEGIEKIIFSGFSKNINSQNKIYNIGRGKPESLMDFIKCIEDNLGKKAILNMMPMQQGDVTETYADVTELERDFNYKPYVNMKEGIKKFIEWFIAIK